MNGTFFDKRDGKTYKTIKIGEQTWIAENLNVSHYRNGDPIQQVQDANEWGKLTIGAWCYYNNDEENGKTYGKLYNGYAVKDPRGLAPEGWHVPSDAEWEILTDYLGGADIAGFKLKETGTIHWQSNTGATNESGFTAFPGNYRDYDGSFYNDMVGHRGEWWSSSEDDFGNIFFRFLICNDSAIKRTYRGKHHGLSVRCLRD
jgi:uncharacterized protein (TIGR02145 family)